jgi:hypothetical protein
MGDSLAARRDGAMGAPIGDRGAEHTVPLQPLRKAR